MNWIRLPKYLKDSGESRTVFYELRDSGDYLEEIHYRYDKKGRVWVNTEAMAAWIEGRKPKRTRSPRAA